MELSKQLDKVDLDLNFTWIPRDQNEASDDLTKERIKKLDAKNRVEADFGKLEFLVLRKLLKGHGAGRGDKGEVLQGESFELWQWQRQNSCQRETPVEATKPEFMRSKRVVKRRRTYMLRLLTCKDQVQSKL